MAIGDVLKRKILSVTSSRVVSWIKYFSLDKALLRDGRFDLQVEVKGLEYKDIHKMIESFNVNPSLLNKICDEYNAETGEVGYQHLFNQSKLQNLIIKYVE